MISGINQFDEAETRYNLIDPPTSKAKREGKRVGAFFSKFVAEVFWVTI